MVLLLAAWMLSRFVPLRYWRSSLGRRQSGDAVSSDPASLSVRPVIRAINRAADRSPITMVCLPRAMAAQWMLARRGLASRFVIGVASPESAQSPHLLHAWIEVGGRVVMGADPRLPFQTALVLETIPVRPAAESTLL